MEATVRQLTVESGVHLDCNFFSGSAAVVQKNCNLFAHLMSQIRRRRPIFVRSSSVSKAGSYCGIEESANGWCAEGQRFEDEEVFVTSSLSAVVAFFSRERTLDLNAPLLVT